MQTLRRNIDLILIILIGFALRLSVSITHSYTNDELSAINRLRFDSFSELIDKGVKSGDMHPAGVQVFEKIWSSAFGTSEVALRLPFVLCGAASILLIFMIGLKWFNRSTGLYAAAFLSFLYFPIIQSELARPYSPGMLIVLLSIWYYGKVLFDVQKKIRHGILLGLSFAAGMYTHYFLFLFVAFIGFTGLFFIKRENYKLYFLAAAIAIVLFLPHLSITVAQLGVGGLQWLGPPENNFLFEFIFYAFNDSMIVLASVLLHILLSVLWSREKQAVFKSRYYILCGVWFFGIYLLGHVISLAFTPILKIQVMYFALPFFFLMLAYLISNFKFSRLSLAFTSLVLIGSSIIENQLYGLRHMGYKNTAMHLVAWNKEYGDENIYTMYNMGNPDYMNFYAVRFGDSLHFERDVIEFWDQHKIRPELIDRQEPYCVIGYSERPTSVQVFETAKEFYPFILESHHFDQSAVFLLSKDSVQRSGRTIFQDESRQQRLGNLELTGQNNLEWSVDPEAFQLLDLNVDSSQKSVATSCYVLENNRIYGPDYIFKKSKITQFRRYYIKAIVKAVCPSDGQLTISLSAKRDGEILQYRNENFWMGQDLEDMLTSTRDSISGIGTAYFAFEIPHYINDSDELKISLWNRNGNPIYITSFEVLVLENNWN